VTRALSVVSTEVGGELKVDKAVAQCFAE